MLVVPREVSGVPMAATRALIRRGVKRLHLVALPTSSLQADLLIGAGCVETLETSAVSLGEFGPAPRFTAAVTSGAIKMKDATCPALHAALQASEKGVPFMPLRGLIGSDVLKYRDDWKVIDSPFGRRRSNRAAAGDQAGRGADPRADGRPFRQCLDRTATRAGHHGACSSARPVATVEKIHDGNLLDDPMLAAGTLPGFYVESIAIAERGAWPLGLPDFYPADADHLAEYARMAATTEGFAEYLDRYVYEKAERRVRPS